MKTLLQLAATCALLIVLVGVLSTPDGALPTVEVLAQPETVVRLEAQRQAHALSLAQIEAEMRDRRAEAVTMRLALVLLALVVVVVVGAVLWDRRQQRRRSLVLLPGAPGFDRLLAEMGGAWVDGAPVVQGREVAYLEWEECDS